MASRRTLADCRVTLGVTGSIAAYKAADIVRRLTGLGVQVRVVMTRSGARLMSPHALATLSGSPVALRMWRPAELLQAGIDHLDLGREPDLLLVAPATANILGKTAGGIADDLLSTAIMAAACPVIFAPAMNVRMWENPVTQRNVAALRELGHHFVGPEAGDLACGETGAGRMAQPEAIADRVARMLLARLDGLRVLVTAGPTEEEIDPVRVLTNRSSGVMGARLAEAARDRGHRVTLIAGPLRCPHPIGVERFDVASAEEMARAVAEAEPRADVLVMAAAVADYRPARREAAKIPSGSAALQIPLVPNTDILASVAPARAARGQVTVGFALEIGDGGEERARAKLRAKGVDMIVLNDPTRSDSAFGGETTQPSFLYRDGRIERAEVMTKYAAAMEIVERAEALRDHAAAGGRTHG
ncbi:MAG: bifunctional phosphopantothenoylcysteine decarboxylase/phosphopantothenate--cysteine ligase CoaBC [Candidatus Eisenbacteria bacterium]|uniref:Coenzyme A biosynthesis bifunctional protein CoaBC n=1 Tax=Eiseniibacteriota bacterium TaxID=2212470 RepID=A0A938BL39_UNCEI|nr:bifunctional phosphopantothenoylcysteine decarboxylase/phosphopantothenate--cysteine ligase CoaBC [Candidatus Eisenbacteria bacterium]